MFGYVTASWKELTAGEQKRYGAVYCGICREIRQRSTGIGRICLSYDMAFLALLLMSLYEPEEESGRKACRLHSVKPRPWVDNEYIRYAADMNVALGYYNCLDDWQDDGKRSAKFMANKLEPFLPELEAAGQGSSGRSEAAFPDYPSWKRKTVPTRRTGLLLWRADGAAAGLPGGHVGERSGADGLQSGQVHLSAGCGGGLR